MSNDQIQGINEQSQFMSKVQQEGQSEDGGAMTPEEFMEQFNQEKDADFTGIEAGGRHFLVKAPDRSRKSGIILSEKQQKELQNVQETPGFQEDVTVILTSDKCEFVEEGDMVLLSPHVNTLEIQMPEEDPEDPEDPDIVLYLMIHEDYVLMRKSSD